MKTILSILIFSILGLNIICAQEKLNLDDPKDQDKFIASAAQELDRRKKVDGTALYYLPFSQVPYSGRYVEFHENGQLRIAFIYKEGKRDGLSYGWHENGQMAGEYNYKDGKKDGFQTYWHENGQKKREENYKDGKEDGPYNDWYENGQKYSEGIKKDDKLMSLTRWKPNGEKCPITNIVDGNGKVVRYEEDGTINSTRTYKDGEIQYL